MATDEKDIEEAIGSQLHIVEVCTFSFLHFFAKAYVPRALKAAVIGSHKHIVGVGVFHQLESDYLLGADRLDVAKHIECFFEDITMQLSVGEHLVDCRKNLLKLERLQ